MSLLSYTVTTHGCKAFRAIEEEDGLITVVLDGTPDGVECSKLVGQSGSRVLNAVESRVGFSYCFFRDLEFGNL